MPECHAGAKWGDLGPINTLFMIPHANGWGFCDGKGSLGLNRFLMSPTYYGGNRT
ncbi:hypothetical protein GA0061098_100745 [Bradyrhizobium shewense]|uniref:Uncharacterized protein n=1 Tax=Bradyrhizobium shewense TaxID=1761772 RepID=A0A1C3W9U7_9BRAD|nr:hypothetical protein GA0061098_100745 [Bradyrhizobium shewense]